MLHISDLNAFYGKSQVLRGVQLHVAAGETVALLGRNGSGRSTTAKAIMGLVHCTGSILWKQQNLVGRKTFEIARQGIGYVPESRDVFSDLSVHQNLLLGERRQPTEGPLWTFDALYALFPQLAARRDVAAGLLSGGEQQMLTLSRSLMGQPQLLIVDEPTEGLAPQLVEQVAHCMRLLKQRGVSVLLIEQKLSISLQVCDRVLVMGQGAVVFDGTPQGLREDTNVQSQWMQV